MVGFAHSAPWVMPCNAGRKRDALAAMLRDAVLNRAFFHLIGARQHKPQKTAECLDFIGINYYTRAVVRSVGWGVNALLGKPCYDSRHNHPGLLSDLGWEIYPHGLQMVLEKFSRFGVPIFITENGVATNDEAVRRDFILKHLEGLAKALASGLKVIGYLYWTLMDNYEWAMGTAPHFGLAAVDPDSQERRPRPSVEVFSRVCRENRLYV